MSIGLDRNTVALADYDASWIDAYIREAEFLKKLLGDEVVNIDHFGSTSIPGMKAKPVIDVLIQAPAMYLTPSAITKLKDNNYAERIFDHREEHMYPKMIGDNIASHNVHVTRIGSIFAEKMLAFRDNLRADHILAREYEALKISVADKYPKDRQAYYKAKVAFFEKVVGRYN